MTDPTTPVPPAAALSEEKLGPCPFCGSGGEELGLCYDTGAQPWLGTDWFVRCYVCHVETERFVNKAEAVTAWNRRPTDAARAQGRTSPAGDGVEAWNWLTAQTNLELSYGYYDEEEDGEWQVHRISGGRNDREWELVGNGQTALAAVQVAQVNLGALSAPPEPAGDGVGKASTNAQRRMAETICEFMGWPEDGPAWDDAMKLARLVHEPAYKEGWNDREGDLLAGADRLSAPELTAEERAALVKIIKTGERPYAETEAFEIVHSAMCKLESHAALRAGSGSPAPIDGELREAVARLTRFADGSLMYEAGYVHGWHELRADLRLLLLQSRQANGAGSAEGWQDISTAPRDGSEILLLSDEVVHHGCWQGPSDGAIYSGSSSRFNWFSRTCGQSLHDDGVTRWAPLALTPASAGEEP